MFATRASRRLGHSGRYRRRTLGGNSPNEVGICCLVLMACGLIASGLYYLSAAHEDKRDSRVDAYAAAVAAWPARRAAFGAAAVAGARLGEAAFALPPSDAADALHDISSTEALPAYEALAYRAAGVVPNNATAAPPPLARESSTVYLGAAAVLRFAMGGQALETAALPLVRLAARHAPTPQPERKCQTQLGGVYREGMCWVTTRLVSACVVVGQGHGDGGDGAAWALQAPPGGGAGVYGCHWASASQNGAAFGGVAGDWSAAEYVIVPPGSEALPFGEAAPPVKVTVRSAADPYLTALYETGGKLDFGDSWRDDRGVGVVLLLAGLCLCIPPGFKYAEMRRESVAYRGLPAGDEEDAAGLGGVGLEMR